MNIEALNRILVNFVRDNIPHPDGSGNKKWIYPDYPRVDAKFPRISITQVAHSTRPAGIGELSAGDKGEWQETSFDIDIWVKKGNRFTIGATAKAGTSLRDYLGDLVIQIFMDKKQWLLQNKQIYDVEITGTLTVPYLDVNELFRRTVTVRITYFRTKA